MVTPSPSQVFAGPEKWTEKAPDGDTSPSLSLVPITIFQLLQSTCTTVALCIATISWRPNHAGAFSPAHAQCSVC